MSNQNDIFDDLIKSQLEGFDANVSMADWDAIEAKLGGAKRKKVAAYWWVAAAVVLVSGMMAVVSLLNNTSNPDLSNTEVVLSEEDASSNKESVVKNYLPIPTEAPSETATNEPNQLEKVNTVIKTTLSGVETKTSLRSTTEADRLPTNIVDIKPRGFHTKGVENLGFSTDFNLETLSSVASPASLLDPSGNTIKFKASREESKWELGFSASPTWASKVINPNGENSWKINEEFDLIASTMESGTVSYQFEARVNRYFNDHVYLGLGINYNQVAEQVSYDYIVDYFVDEDVIKKEVNNEYDPRLHTEVKYSGKNVYHYIEVPARLGFIQSVPNSNLQIRVEAGLRYMILADMSGKKVGVTRTDSLMDLKTSMATYSRHNLGFTTNAGLFWQVNTKMDFGFIPYYNLSMSSIRKRDEGITEKPYNFGVNFSLQHKIWIK
ncbi:MAG: hypothetical protein ACI9JN_002392 [Bacteroidia bacterium]